MRSLLFVVALAAVVFTAAAEVVGAQAVLARGAQVRVILQDPSGKYLTGSRRTSTVYGTVVTVTSDSLRYTPVGAAASTSVDWQHVRSVAVRRKMSRVSGAVMGALTGALIGTAAGGVTKLGLWSEGPGIGTFVRGGAIGGAGIGLAAGFSAAGATWRRIPVR